MARRRAVATSTQLIRVALRLISTSPVPDDRKKTAHTGAGALTVAVTKTPFKVSRRSNGLATLTLELLPV
jgi:hypothetical protein